MAENSLPQIYERLGALDQKVSAAHFRTDKLEVMMKEDLTEIKADVKALMKESHESKGWKKAAFLFAGIIGGLISALITIFFGK